MHPIFCQQDWSIVYDQNLNYDDLVQVEVYADTIYTVGHNWTTDVDTNYCVGSNFLETTAAQGILFAKYDSFGVKVCEKIIYDSTRLLATYASHFSGFKIYNRKLYFYGTSVQYYTYLIICNTDFSNDTVIFYPPNPGVNFTGATGLLATESGLYLLAQQKKPGELNDILVIHTDLDGKEVWRKVYGVTNGDELALSIINNSENIIISGCRTAHPFASAMNQWSKEWILQIDTNGLILSDWVSEDVANRGCILSMKNVGESYIYNSSVNMYISDTDYRRVNNICKRDTATKSLLWQTDFDSPNNNWFSVIWANTLTPDSTAIIGVGKKDDGGPAFHYKVNAQTGEIIYKRNFEGCTEEYDAIDTDLFDVACLSSGSTVACGYTVLNTPIAPAYTGWIIKTNAYGIDLLDDCSTVPAIDQPTYTGVEMKVYPNPATTQITLNLPESKEVYQIRIINLNGKVVYQTSNQAADPRIDIAHLPTGMYVVQILGKYNTIINAQKFVKIE